MVKNKPRLSILIILTAFASVCAVLYTPGIPQMARDFGISGAVAQSSMSIFLLGYTLGQLFYGPITNRFGRKSTIFFGVYIAIVGSATCVLGALCLYYPLFLAGRFLQALGSSVGLVIAFAMINDVYEGAEARRIISYTTLAFATLPGLATFLGGLLVQQFHWMSCFYFLTGYSILVLLLSTTCPETSSFHDTHALQPRKIWLSYNSVIKDPRVVTYASIWGLSTALIYIFAAIAPQVTQTHLGASPTLFGILNLTTCAGLITGNLFSAQIVHKVNAREGIMIGLSLGFCGALALGLTTFMGHLNLATLYISVYVIYSGLPLMYTNASALAARGATDKATTTSVITLTNLSVAVTGSMLFGLVPIEIVTQFLPEVFLCIVGVAMILLLFAEPTNKRDR